MSCRTALLVAAVGAALVVPRNAAAVDHVTLFISPTKLSPSGWKLSAAVVGATAPGARETFGISLTRKLGNGRGEEQHGLRAAPTGTVSFDGRSGRWAARFGTVVAIGMTVTAVGQTKDVGESLGCRGAFATVPVRLRGNFVLRTGTSFFGTIRRLDLAGSVTFNRGGAVDCAAPAVGAACSPSSVLTAARQELAGPAATLLLSPDAGGWLTLSFADRGGAIPAGVTWYHVMRSERLGFDPLAGRPPSIAVDLPSALAVQGSGTFSATETSTDTRGACRRLSAKGTFTGSFRTRFAGWGARIAAFGRSGSASFAEESA
jgi:hypothetical protein